ncbi:MAG: MFS transporter [Acidimicrobiales bacterium]
MTSEGSSGSFAPDPGAADPGDTVLGTPDRRPPFGLIVAITVTGIMGNTLITPVAPDIVADFGVGSTGLGFVLGAATAPGILLAPVIGVLADRFGRRELLLPCLMLFGVGGGLAAFAPSFGVLIGLRVVQGLGSAGLINLAVVLIGDNWDGAERAKIIGRNAATLTIALAVLPPIGGMLGDVGGWRYSFVPYWIALGTAFFVWRILPAGTRGDRTIGEQLRELGPSLRLLPVVGSLVVGFVLFVIIFGLVLTVLPAYLAADFGASASTRGLVLGFPAITSTVVAFNLGRLRKRFGGRMLVTIGCVGVGASMFVFASAPTFALLLLAPPLYGIGEGMLIPTLQDLVSGAAPTASRGSVVAIWVSVARLGQTIGPIAAGFGLEHTTPSVMFAAGGTAAVLLAAAVRFVRLGGANAIAGAHPSA